MLSGEMSSHRLSELLSLLEEATVYDLEHPRRVGDPIFPAHWPGYVYTLHRRHEAGLERRTSASGLITQAEHSGTHIDALCHQAEDLRLCGGIEIDAKVQGPQGFSRLGMETVAPILRRGVLLDVARLRGEPVPPGEQIEAAELEATVRAQQLEIRAGDVVLVRTGNATRWEDGDHYLQGGGIAASASSWLARMGPFAVGADLVAWDLPGFVDPGTGTTLPGHLILLVRAGVHIIENLNLEGLSGDGTREFLFCCLPPKYAGATGSPVRPVAIRP